MNWLSPNVLLAGVIALGGIGLAGYHVAKVSRATDKGEQVGAAAVVTKIAEKAADTVAKVAEGEAAAPDVPSDKALLRALCDRSASCRDRKR